MSESTSVSHSGHVDQALRLRWPVAIVTVLFTVSYPANDFEGLNSPWHDHGEADTSGPMLMVLAAIALVTAFVVFAVLMPWAIRGQRIGVVALTLSAVGFLLAPGFWTCVPPIVAAGGALLGWAGIDAPKGRRLSLAAVVVGVLGVMANVYSYAIVFV
jgi:hypothetical protein